MFTAVSFPQALTHHLACGPSGPRSWGAAMKRSARPRAGVAVCAVLVTMVTAGLAVEASSATSPRTRDWGEPSASATFGIPPALLPEFQRERERAQRREEERRTPEARAERRHSRDAYKDLDRNGAIVLAKDRFPRVFGEPLWRKPRLAKGERIARYVSDSAFVVERTGVQGGLLTVSSAPVRAEDGSGHKAPVDTALERHDGALEPSNTNADPQIATE